MTASTHTTACIPILLFFFLALCCSDRVGAGEDDILEDEFELLEEETVYSSARHEQVIFDAASAITVISRQEIVNTHCLDVVCLLRQVAEVDVLRIKPMYAVVGARAFTDYAEQRVLVLVDGREINEEIFGLVHWQALPVHLEEIERIEVIRGPGSALYGANAHSMVVSIFTRQPQEHTARIFVGLGERGRSSVHALAGQTVGPWKLRLSGGGDWADHWNIPGVRERSIGRLNLSVRRETGTGQFIARAGVMLADGAIFSFLGPASFEDATYGHVQLDYDIEFLRTQLTFGLFGASIPISSSKEPWQQIYVGGITLGRIHNILDFFSTNLDAQVQAEFSLFQDNLLISGLNYRWIWGSSDDTAPESMHQHRLGLFLHDEQRLFEQLLLTASVRFDYNNITPFTVSPRAALVWQAHANHAMRVAFARAFRKPSFLNSTVHVGDVVAEPSFPEFEDFFRDAVGNEDLDNESITTIEAGYVGRFPAAGVSLDADVFYNRYRDTIAFYLDMASNSFGLPDLEHSVAEYRNTGREADAVGGSLSLVWRFFGSFRLRANYTYRYTFYVSEPVGLAVVGEGGRGDRISWEPAHLFNLAFSHLPERGIRWGVALHANSGRNSMVSTAGAFDRRVLLPQDPVWFLSAFVSRRVRFGGGWVEAGVRAFDLLGFGFYDWPGPEPPSPGGNGGEKLDRQVVLFLRGAV